jgi:uncharacterized protein YqeY
MALLDDLTSDLTASMKARDAPRTSVLRMAKAALKNREIDKRESLDDTEVVAVLVGLVKQREESAEQFRKGGRPELAEKEEAEIDVLKGYIPQEASEAEILAAVDDAISVTGASSPKDLGRVMKETLSSLKASGKPVDGKKVNLEVRKRLGG